MHVLQRLWPTPLHSTHSIDYVVLLLLRESEFPRPTLTGCPPLAVRSDYQDKGFATLIIKSLKEILSTVAPGCLRDMDTRRLHVPKKTRIESREAS